MIKKLLSISFGLFALLMWAFPAAGEKQPLDKIVAVVNDNVITQQEFDVRLKSIVQQMQSSGNPLPPQDVLTKQVLEYLINEHLQLQIAEQNGITTNDKAVDEAIHRIAQQNNVNLEQFRALLEKDGYNYNQFREDIRNELTVNTVQQRKARNQVTVSDEEIDNFLKQTQLSQRNGEYHIAHILIALPEEPTPEQTEEAQNKANKALAEIKDGTAFSEVVAEYSDGQNALEGGDLGWRNIAELPYLFITPLLSMQMGDTSDVLRNPSGFHIIKLIDKKVNQQSHQVQQTLARHILIKTSLITKDADAKRTLTEVRQRIVKGANFAQLAKEYSDDPGTVNEGGDLGWTNPEQFDPIFAQEMAKLAPKQISEPFKTPFGWHIIQVEDRRTIDSTEEFQRNQVRQLIQRRKFEDSLQDWITELRTTAHVEIKT